MSECSGWRAGTARAVGLALHSTQYIPQSSTNQYPSWSINTIYSIFSTCWCIPIQTRAITYNIYQYILIHVAHVNTHKWIWMQTNTYQCIQYIRMILYVKYVAININTHKYRWYMPLNTNTNQYMLTHISNHEYRQKPTSINMYSTYKTYWCRPIQTITYLVTENANTYSYMYYVPYEYRQIFINMQRTYHI